MDAAIDLHDARRTPRRLLTRLLRVTDIATGRQIGDIVNLSSSGFMLISKAPVPADERLLLMLDLPASTGDAHRIRLEARCLWCASSSFSEDYGAGFEIIHVSAGDQRRLQQWYSAAPCWTA